MTLLDMARELEGQPDRMAELMNAAIKHHPTCSADYPEKPENEKPQQIESMDIGDGETVHQCVDCGASKVTNAQGEEVPPVDSPRDPLHQDYIDASKPDVDEVIPPAMKQAGEILGSTFSLTPPPAPVDPSQPHKINDVQAALEFMLAGNAYFTIRSMKSGMRYTFRVNLAKNRNDNPRFRNVVTHFVSLLAGPDNTQDYVYMGIIRDREFKITGKSRFIDSSQPVIAFKWFLGWLQRNAFPPQVELWHEGRCGRCGRKLTVPESIARGIGPECAGLMK